MKNYILLWVCLWCAGQLCAETAVSKSLDINIVGHVLDKNTREHLPYISVVLKGTTIGVMTDASGHYFLKNLPEGDFFLETSSVGYKTERRKVSLRRGTTLEIDFEIEEDAVVLDGVVVSANRSETTRQLAPTLVNVLNIKTFENTNSNSLAQGLIKIRSSRFTSSLWILLPARSKTVPTSPGKKSRQSRSLPSFTMSAGSLSDVQWRSFVPRGI